MVSFVLAYVIWGPCSIVVAPRNTLVLGESFRSLVLFNMRAGQRLR